MGYLRTIKDKTFSLVIKRVANYLIRDFGTLDSLTIDSQTKSIQITANLKGELTPLHLTVSDYEFKRIGNKNYVIPRNLFTSREWMNVFIARYLTETKIEIPDGLLGKAVEFIL